MTTTYDDWRNGHDFTISIDNGTLTLDCECGDVITLRSPSVSLSELISIQRGHVQHRMTP